jgi:hypothetical protein
MKFAIFKIFWSPNGSSNSQINIRTDKFQFKRTNQELPRHYRLPAPATGTTARPGSSADDSTHSHQAVAVAPTQLTTSAQTDDSAQDTDGSASVAQSLKPA